MDENFCKYNNSDFNNPKKLSIAALSRQLPLRLSLIHILLVQDEQRIRQKFDNVSGFGLLAVPADPPRALRILLDPVIGQRGHIRIADAREAGEQERCV